MKGRSVRGSVLATELTKKVHFFLNLSCSQIIGQIYLGYPKLGVERQLGLIYTIKGHQHKEKACELNHDEKFPQNHCDYGAR